MRGLDPMIEDETKNSTIECDDNPAGDWVRVPPIDRIAWARLYGELMQISVDNRAGIDPPGCPPGFMAAEAGLQAVVRFLSQVPELMTPGAVAPLSRLSAAMADLREGRAPPLLAPRPKPHRASRCSHDAAVVGFAARCMSELMEAATPAPQAAKAVAAALIA
ncbi:MAG: hypothetical protein POH28_03450, partial [Acidocella sp.]|nr:hypothetical protein [Acidocella sp.]